MSFQNTKLAELFTATLPTGTGTPLYTAPGSTYAKVKNIVVYNDDSGSHTFSLWVVQSGGSVGLTTKRYALTVTTKQTVVIAVDFYLNAGGAIYATSDAGTTMSCAGYGCEFTTV